MYSPLNSYFIYIEYWTLNIYYYYNFSCSMNVLKNNIHVIHLSKEHEYICPMNVLKNNGHVIYDFKDCRRIVIDSSEHCQTFYRQRQYHLHKTIAICIHTDCIEGYDASNNTYK